MRDLINYIGEAFKNHYTLELTGIPILIGGFVTVVVALFQLRSQARGNRASVLMTIDQQGKEEPIRKARARMRQIRDAIRAAEAGWKQNHQQPDIERLRREKAKNMVDAIQSHDPDAYICLVDAMSYLETMGYVVKRKYIRFDDAYLLWGGIIMGAGIILEPHILDLQDTAQDKEIYENFLWILERCRNRQTGIFVRWIRRRLRR